VKRRLAWLACGLLTALGPPPARAQRPAATDGPRAAFVQDVSALQARGPRVPSPADSALRRRIVQDARALEPRPQPPAGARARFEHARRASQHCSCRDSTLYAVEELALALHDAPWWGDGYRRLGVALQRLVRNTEAGVCLGLYLAAEPATPDRNRLERQAARLLERGRTSGASAAGPAR
jgi:hypothetical protein